jgi:hypothetical protein
VCVGGGCVLVQEGGELFSGMRERGWGVQPPGRQLLLQCSGMLCHGMQVGNESSLFSAGSCLLQQSSTKTTAGDRRVGL